MRGVRHFFDHLHKRIANIFAVPLVFATNEIVRWIWDAIDRLSLKFCGIQHRVAGALV